MHWRNKAPGPGVPLPPPPPDKEEEEEDEKEEDEDEDEDEEEEEELTPTRRGTVWVEERKNWLHFGSKTGRNTLCVKERNRNRKN